MRQAEDDYWVSEEGDSEDDIMMAVELNTTLDAQKYDALTPEEQKEYLKRKAKLNKPETNIEEVNPFVFNPKTKELQLNIERASRFILNKLPIITTGELVFSMWYYDKDEGYYKRGAEKQIQILLQQKTKGQQLKINIVREIIAQIQRETFTDETKLNEATLNLVCVKNGILNITTKELKPHNSKTIFTQQIPVKYKPDKKCPEILNYLKSVIEVDDLNTFQEMVGHLLIRDYRYKKAFIFAGQKDTGKTTTLKLLINFIGQQNTSSESLHRLTKDKFSGINLYGKLVNFFDDLSAEDINDAGSLKIATGNGYISGERKFGERISFQNYAKLLFACNQIFGLKDRDQDDEAYYGRWIIFFFNNVFEGKKQDKSILNKLISDEELSGFLNWALQGLDRLEEQGQFSYSKTPEEIKLLMQKGSNNLAGFSQDCLTQSDGEWISKETLYIAYCTYVKDKGGQRFTKEKLGRDLPKFAKFILESKRDKITGWLNVKLNQTFQAFDKVISNISDTTTFTEIEDIYPYVRDEKNSMKSMIEKVSDGILLPCSLCDAPPPCYFTNTKGRPLCELCANPTKENKLED
jgi:P4 family phage/plasmid primase-like protien